MKTFSAWLYLGDPYKLPVRAGRQETMTLTASVQGHLHTQFAAGTHQMSTVEYFSSWVVCREPCYPYLSTREKADPDLPYP